MSTVKKRHKNIPIFIPHLGCPNNCVFCNQRSISGKLEFRRESVVDELERALSTINGSDEVEIAFFGGSFTGIERGLMIYLLDTAEKYVIDGKVSSIRMSTRPDYINDEIIGILSRYHVKTIELGLQSMDDAVLAAAKRGHTARIAEDACRRIKVAGYELIGQMMIGLPGASAESEQMTARLICECGADGARVYPTVVFYETELCEMAKQGQYEPLTEQEAIMRTKSVLDIFANNGIPCIRVGLCASEGLSSDESVYGGASHSAIGELAMGELYYERIRNAISAELSHNTSGQITSLVITVPTGCTSKAIGQKRRNKQRLADELGIRTKNIRIRESAALSSLRYEVSVELFNDAGGKDCT